MTPCRPDLHSPRHFAASNDSYGAIFRSKYEGPCGNRLSRSSNLEICDCETHRTPEIKLDDAAEIVVDAMFVRIRMYELLRVKFAIAWYTILSGASKRRERVFHC
jgi:hypothetical protein